MRHIKSPERWKALDGEVSVFLAGSIEQGRAENWQERIISTLRYTDVLVVNPRREEWSPILGDGDDQELLRQIDWELESLECVDVAAFYFSPGTISPVSLLELGLVCQRKRTIVCCPQGYWRKANVDAVCDRYLVDRVSGLESLALAIKEVCSALSHS